MSMFLSSTKKIILVGPPEAGKSTIKKVFFKNGNPLKLIKYSLEPTRGVNSSNFTLFDTKLSIFDLAGQENEYWFSRKRDIFENADIIICIFDITSPVELIISFLLKILKTKKKISSLSDTEIFVFLHKIDKINLDYFKQKVKIIDDFKAQFPKSKKLRVFGTSIARNYFYSTFLVLLEILKSNYKTNIINISNSEFVNLKTEISIIFLFNTDKYKKIEEVKDKLDLNEEELSYHLKRLIKLGFLKFLAHKKVIQLTIRSEFLKDELRQEIVEKGLTINNNSIQLLHTFLDLTMISAESLAIF